MGSKKLHLHSIMIHSLLALAPLAALAYILLTTGINILSFGTQTWDLIVKFSIFMLLILSFPSMLSGIFERNRMYAQWHFSHKAKTIISLLLILATLMEFIGLLKQGNTTELSYFLGISIIFINNLLCFFLNYFGLKITLGRQSLKKPSYTPDLYKKDQVDILEKASQYAKEEPKFVDILQER